MHHQSHRDNGRKKKKDKQNKNKENADETTGSEEVTNETNSGNTNNNQTGENGPTITAQMHQEDDEEFKEALLVEARSGDNYFDITELKDYSLASVYSKESLGGAYFEVLEAKDDVDNEINIAKEENCRQRIKHSIIPRIHHRRIGFKSTTTKDGVETNRQ